MNLRVNWIRMAKIPRCKHDGFLMENLGRWNEGALGGEKHGLCESCTHQVDLQSTVIPTLERWPAKIHVVDLDSLRAYVLCQACQKWFLSLAFIERGVDEVDAQNADGLLLEGIGSIAHIHVQQDVVGRSPGLELKAETGPTM